MNKPAVNPTHPILRHGHSFAATATDGDASACAPPNWSNDRPAVLSVDGASDEIGETKRSPF
jgi:hypothetical protein